MKKEILLSLFLVSGLNAFDIKFSKNFTKEINKDEVSSYIEIISKNKNQTNSINNLNNIRELLKTTKKVKIINQKQNSYPLYEYEKNSNNRVLKGYSTNINFSISSKNKKDINSFLDKLLSKKNDNLTISFNSLSQKISEEQIEKEKQNLEFDVIVWAKEYEQTIYKNTNQKCKLKELILNDRETPQLLFRESFSKQVKSVNNDKIDLELPNEKGKINISAKFKYECEDGK